MGWGYVRGIQGEGFLVYGQRPKGREKEKRHPILGDGRRLCQCWSPFSILLAEALFQEKMAVTSISCE